MIYLMEKDSRIFHMLKEVSYEGQPIEIKPQSSFEDSYVENSELVVLPGTHYCYLENIIEVGNLINSFIKEEELFYL